MPDSLDIDDSVVVWSEPASALADRPLVVLMHGRGSHENDLPSLVPYLPARFVYASLRAPRLFEGGGGFSWFATGEPGAPDPAIADASTRGVLAWLDRIAPVGPVVAAGFSQGGAMAIHLMRHAPERFAGYVNLAGFVIPGTAPADDRLDKLRPPVFWGRDADDPVIPHTAIDRTQAWLPARTELVTRTYPGIGHSISREELEDVSEFLEANIG